ncbi:MAG: hypothetical protein M3279_05410 [Actinomycetota bacterium]|nr:hypothetical protein [Actinomycetota bacterium]
MRGRSFLGTIAGDGRPLLLAVSGSLVFAGGFAIFLAASGEFLPHDVAFLGMTPEALCRIAGCRVVDFMLHDRAAWGGALVAIGVMYAWLVLFPLGRGEAWAWWVLVVSGVIGFLTFLGYFGYGYLDTWHGLGTLLLVPVFAYGAARTRTLVARTKPAIPPLQRDSRSLGRIVLIMGAAGSAFAGGVILTIGVTDIFVPEDIEFIGRTADDLRALDPQLVPLIAHDRAGFGGAVLVAGLVGCACLVFSEVTRDLWEALAVAGAVSLSAATSVHLFVGYTDFGHLVPPLLGIASLVVGLSLAAAPERRHSAVHAGRRIANLDP